MILASKIWLDNFEGAIDMGYSEEEARKIANKVEDDYYDRVDDTIFAMNFWFGGINNADSQI